MTDLLSQLRELAAQHEADGDAGGAQTLLSAAAEIEGGREAFTVVVADKAELSQSLSQSQSNHRHTLDFLARWRELLVALRAEHPDDIRLKRALMGEHPMRPAPWEKQS